MPRVISRKVSACGFKRSSVTINLAYQSFIPKLLNLPGTDSKRKFSLSFTPSKTEISESKSVTLLVR